jgi:hypothetical protein
MVEPSQVVPCQAYGNAADPLFARVFQPIVVAVDVDVTGQTGHDHVDGGYPSRHIVCQVQLRLGARDGGTIGDLCPLNGWSTRVTTVIVWLSPTARLPKFTVTTWSSNEIPFLG